jgi:hypothetical protein
MRAIALTMKAGDTLETSINFYQTTRHYNPADSRLQKSDSPNQRRSASHVKRKVKDDS